LLFFQPTQLQDLCIQLDLVRNAILLADIMEILDNIASRRVERFGRVVRAKEKGYKIEELGISSISKVDSSV
jgi:hypothetical protein